MMAVAYDGHLFFIELWKVYLTFFRWLIYTINGK